VMLNGGKFEAQKILIKADIDGHVSNALWSSARSSKNLRQGPMTPEASVQPMSEYSGRWRNGESLTQPNQDTNTSRFLRACGMPCCFD
jgi:hypothetical protein